MTTEEMFAIALGFVAGYYAVTHYVKTKSPV